MSAELDSPEPSAAGGPTSVSRLGSAGVVVAGAGLVVNALGYVTPVLGAHLLPATELSELATALAVASIASVPGIGLQTALAVRWARDGVGGRASPAVWSTAIVTGGAVAVAAPAAAALLRLPVVPLLFVAVSTVGSVATGRWLGELQGRQRFGRLAVGLVLLAIGRYAGVIAGLWAGAGVARSLALGAAVGLTTLPLLSLLTRSVRPEMPVAAAPTPVASATAAAPDWPRSTARLGRSIVAASGATAAMLAVSYADLLLARYFLSPADSGAYAVGAVLTKGALWAPQVVTVLALPRLAQGNRRALTVSLTLVAGCGVILVLASTLAGRAAMTVAGGPGYAALSSYAPWFAAVGACYAVVFVLVNAEIAARVRWPALAVWISLTAMTVTAAVLHVGSLRAVLLLSLATAATTVAVMGLLASSRRRRTRGGFADQRGAHSHDVLAVGHPHQVAEDLAVNRPK